MGRREIVWVAVIVVLLAISMGPASTRRTTSYPEYDLFVKLIEQVRDTYVTPIDDKKLFQGAMEGVTRELDPYSQYLPPREAKELRVDTEGQYGGLGIQISLQKNKLTKKDQLIVVTPIEDTPAYKAGVVAGDIILEIDGKDTEGFTIQDAVDLLRGKPGAPVTLTLIHEGARKPHKIKITRARIRIRSVKGYERLPEGPGWSYWADKEGKIGYVRITQFQEKTVNSMDKIVEKLNAEGMNGLIIDLRNNPGGLLNIAIDMANRFIDRGFIVLTKGRTKDAYKEYSASPDDDYEKFKVVILVNGSSASASEIVAGCLQDRRRAAIVGERTFGKGSVQTVYTLRDEHKLKLTTAHYYTPTGRNIHRSEDAKETDDWGVIPDVVVKLTRKEMLALRDKSIAMEIIRGPKDGDEDDDDEQTDEGGKDDGKLNEEGKTEDKDAEDTDEEAEPESPDETKTEDPVDKNTKSEVVDKQLVKAIELIKDDVAFQQALESDEYEREDEETPAKD